MCEEMRKGLHGSLHFSLVLRSCFRRYFFSGTPLPSLISHTNFVYLRFSLFLSFNFPTGEALRKDYYSCRSGNGGGEGRSDTLRGSYLWCCFSGCWRRFRVRNFRSSFCYWILYFSHGFTILDDSNAKIITY